MRGDLIIPDDSEYRKSEIVALPPGSFFFSSGIWIDWVVFIVRFSYAYVWLSRKKVKDKWVGKKKV